MERAGALLDLLARHPQGLTITELTQALDTQRAPLYRILNALIAHRLVQRDARKGYSLGVGTVTLAQSYLSRFSAGVDSVLSDLANSTGLGVTLVAVDGEDLTTVSSVTTGLDVPHLYTPPGYTFPPGPLATRIALRALDPPRDDDPPEVVQARIDGYCAATWTGGEVPRYAMSAVIPTEGGARPRFAIVLISLVPFDVDACVEAMRGAVDTLSMMLRSGSQQALDTRRRRGGR